MTKDNIYPRLIRIRDIPEYLATNINYFNKEIRPHLTPIKVGKRGVAFDILDLDRWIKQNKGRGGKRPNNKGDLKWDENAHQGSTNAEDPGILTNKSSDNEFWKTLELVLLKKLKKF